VRVSNVSWGNSREIRQRRETNEEIRSTKSLLEVNDRMQRIRQCQARKSGTYVLRLKSGRTETQIDGALPKAQAHHLPDMKIRWDPNRGKGYIRDP